MTRSFGQWYVVWVEFLDSGGFFYEGFIFLGIPFWNPTTEWEKYGKMMVF